MWWRWLRLKQMGVLGINNRNLSFIQRYNTRTHYPLVDDKVKTKKLAQAHDVKVPTLYTVIHSEHDNKVFSKLIQNRAQFVIKPAQGAGGEGILVVTHYINNRYRLSNGKLLTEDEIKYHISTTLSGAYSLGGYPDKVMVEYLVQFDDVFEKVAYQGVPDVRVIVIKGFPVMAMVRLPTQASNGKANLHQGAIGAGVDLKTGQTLHGVWHNEIVTHHPDTLHEIEGVTIPYWKECLLIASRCYDMTKLGYLGVDLVLDKAHGPMMLELNARPGLNIQIANQVGLQRRFDMIKPVLDKEMDAKARIEYVLSRL
ncbi:alpha-L-glutamate ligase-like protein [Facilibium subflavum]|uniref:alpha-L-glutamate ligase-like protein n=1 Tax=Facilibium subflavum TaxID=2219058 RepID=UPI000E65DFB8|nr:alpha-L-glutamate ligase-like protein [Facilibium subflavum]